MNNSIDQTASEKPGITRYLVLGLIGIIVLAALYILSRYNYLLSHILIEIFSIVIAYAIFVLAWNSRRMADNYFILFLGISFLFIAGLDLIHTMAYKGMGVFPEFGTDQATQLWIAARYIQAVSIFLAIFWFLKRKYNPSVVFVVYLVVTALLLASIFYWHIFPAAFIDGVGLTSFKINSEYIISFILLCSIGLLIRNRKEFDSGVVNLMVASIAVTIASEMAFTLYADAYGIANMIGHLLKVVSFYLIYKALIETGLAKPYALLFHNLKQRETDLANRAAQLTEINNRLEQEAAERQKAEDTLKQRTIELENLNKELESFSYSVSHDLRAPLRAMDGFSQIILEDYGDKLDDQGKEYLERIRVSSKLMAKLIDDLLALSRVTRTPMNLEKINLSELAEGSAIELQKTQPERRVTFRIKPGLEAIGDRSLLKLALDNLLGNAFKFTGKIDRPVIEFGANNDQGQFIYFIRDNGAGFDQTYVDKLFKPFQRLHSAEEFPGTGIGLASVQRIIRRLGGNIWAEGQKNQGATFYFTLMQ